MSPLVLHYVSVLFFSVLDIRGHTLPLVFKISMKVLCSAGLHLHGIALGSPFFFMCQDWAARLSLLERASCPKSLLRSSFTSTLTWFAADVVASSLDDRWILRTLYLRALSGRSPFAISSLIVSTRFNEMYLYRYRQRSFIILLRISSLACFLSPLLLFFSSLRIRNGGPAIGNIDGLN